MNNNEIGDSGAISIASTLDFLENLNVLDIRNNKIGLVGLQAILLKIKDHKNSPELQCSIKESDLDSLKIFSQVQSAQIEDGFKLNFERLK
ncbi:hypothetical protein [Candidatus Paracaedibacter symbiosus]|uniref:hypothetical protein n=1 Tax=Candidatus Paracaedibacter symbiosus TaxID=244582 RepID=UPI0005098CE5|nr:hypothetical protein [Candidatus Paracaedibacter symbiosus]